MYLVIRCAGCSHMLVTTQSRHHILCPHCGVTSSSDETRIYVTCQDRDTASDIASQLTDIIRRRQGRDLSEEEVIMLQQRFAAWERQTGWK